VEPVTAHQLQEGVHNPNRDETEHERIDRNLSELIEELRVALPGIQVLFAFLLILPFNQRFAEVTASQKDLYFAVLICTALAASFLMAPTMHHRLQFRQNRKPRILWWSHRLALVGLTLLALAMTGAVFFVGDFVFDSTTAAIGAAIPAFTIAVNWYVLPALGRR
jgi:hypothetical protein